MWDKLSKVQVMRGVIDNDDSDDIMMETEFCVYQLTCESSIVLSLNLTVAVSRSERSA